MGILSPDVEELAFPTIFCGERRAQNSERKVRLKYSDICKSELRQRDRRAAQSTANIFFKAKKLQLKQIQDKIWLSTKRIKLKGRTLKGSDFKQNASETVAKLVNLNEGFRIFRTLRSSPPYWESAKRDVFAMIRQLGLPTWFISLSAAETHWHELLSALGKIVDQIDYSTEQIDSMTWQTKCRLIKSDPVTASTF